MLDPAMGDIWYDYSQRVMRGLRAENERLRAALEGVQTALNYSRFPQIQLALTLIRKVLVESQQRPVMDDKPDLATRVEQFNCLELPGQPRTMHMGTNYLVNDLWREIERPRVALEWYADPVNWHNRQGMIQAMNALDDKGACARAALKV